MHYRSGVQIDRAPEISMTCHSFFFFFFPSPSTVVPEVRGELEIDPPADKTKGAEDSSGERPILNTVNTA